MKKSLSVHTESFGFEKEWLVKLIRITDHYHDIFARTDNQVLLGMGNRKINALYTWASGMEIISGGKKSIQLTALGKNIKEHDEYLNEYGTWIVLIHNLSVYPPHNPALFYWFFNEFGRYEFSRAELKKEFDAASIFTHISNITKEKGLTALLAALRNTVISEELQLLQEIERGRFRKGYPVRDFFHPLIFAYCIVDWVTRNGQHDTVQIEDIVHRHGMPGRVFNLPERYVQEKIDEVDIKYSKKIFDVERFSGLNRVVIKTYDP
ncbi:MAG: DUF4007 family protein, partial [Candidatus Hodarchaeales archaeon]